MAKRCFIFLKVIEITDNLLVIGNNHAEFTMRTKIGIVFLIAGIATMSCRKTKLKDEQEILSGEWKWIYTEEYIDPNIFTVATLESVVLADSFPKKYELHFGTNGKMYRWQDEESIKDRIVVKNFEAVTPTFFAILVYGDNKEKNALTMNLLDRAVDTLVVEEYPFDVVHDANGRTYYHKNYYIRK